MGLRGSTQIDRGIDPEDRRRVLDEEGAVLIQKEMCCGDAGKGQNMRDQNVAYQAETHVLEQSIQSI